MKLAIFLSLALFPRPLQAEEVAELRLAGDSNLSLSPSVGQYLSTIFLLPLALAQGLPPLGYGAYPYDDDHDFLNGSRSWSGAAWTAWQRGPGGRPVSLGFLRLRGANRLGWDFAASGYGAGIFSGSRRAGYYAGHLTGNYLRKESFIFEGGVGFLAFKDERTQWGPSGELALEVFARKPWTARLRYQAGVSREKGFHDLTVGVGASWRWLGLTAGWRAFLNSRRTVSGPEFSINGWF